MNGPTAIETRYAGCKFRSRLEARWAVFFDTLGVRWEYEKQGYEREVAGEVFRWLPDFELPDMDVLVEVKSNHAALTLDLARIVHASAGRKVVFLSDIPRPSSTRAVHLAKLPALGWFERLPPAFAWCWFEVGNPLAPGFTGLVNSGRETGVSGSFPPANLWGYLSDLRAFDAINEALTSARSARFEFGVSG